MGYYHKLVDNPRVTHGRPMDCCYDLVGDPRVTHRLLEIHCNQRMNHTVSTDCIAQW